MSNLSDLSDPSSLSDLSGLINCKCKDLVSMNEWPVTVIAIRNASILMALNLSFLCFDQILLYSMSRDGSK